MKQSYRPLVSIVCPCFNVCGFLAETLASVQAQSWVDWELLVIDDGSTDGTADIVSDFVVKDERIQLLRQRKNCGSSAARNLGIGLAKGKFLAFIDSDDLWAREKLDKQIRFMRRNDCGLSYTIYRKINSQGLAISKSIIPDAHVTYSSLLKHCCIPFSSAMLDLQKTEKVYMRPEISLGEDHVFWLEKFLKESYYQSACLLFGLGKAHCHITSFGKRLASGEFTEKYWG